MRNDQYKNILICNLVNLGDVVFATAALGILRSTYPNARITYMIRSGVAVVMRNHPYIDEIIEYEYKSKDGIKNLWNFAQKLKSYNFDLSIAMDRRPRTIILLYLAQIKERIGVNKMYAEDSSWSSMLNTKTIKLDYKLFTRLHHENLQEMIRRFTGSDLSLQPVIAKAPPENIMVAQRLLSELPDGKKYIALCVRALYKLKNWPAEYFAELIQLLARKDDIAMFIIGTDEDFEYADNIIKVSQVPVANFCGKTSLWDLIALYNLSHMMISIDNGAVHLAAASGLPIVSIFGATTPIYAKPASEISEAVYMGLPCSPCSKYSCDNKHECMTQITPKVVLDKVDRVLGIINSIR